MTNASAILHTEKQNVSIHATNASILTYGEAKCKPPCDYCINFCLHTEKQSVSIHVTTASILIFCIRQNKMLNPCDHCIHFNFLHTEKQNVSTHVTTPSIFCM